MSRVFECMAQRFCFPTLNSISRQRERIVAARIAPDRAPEEIDKGDSAAVGVAFGSRSFGRKTLRSGGHRNVEPRRRFSGENGRVSAKTATVVSEFSVGLADRTRRLREAS